MKRLVNFPDVFDEEQVEKISGLIEEAEGGLYLLIDRNENLGSATVKMSVAELAAGWLASIEHRPEIGMLMHSVLKLEAMK